MRFDDAFGQSLIPLDFRAGEFPAIAAGCRGVTHRESRAGNASAIEKE